MKFLTKNPNSGIHTEGLVYLKNANNTALRNRLLSEQKNFCAYTEKYVQDLTWIFRCKPFFTEGVLFDILTHCF